jgi:16S rRNA A1518/A1519 N6-dimethyltransferase RsmA/KsgA/DIM1 with predicted DNA glycosylase/AP lyase activity
MDRLRQIVTAAEHDRDEMVLDVGTGAGVLTRLIRPYEPSLVIACDLAEHMLAHVHKKYPFVLTHNATWCGFR